jgi:hypothetical protein
MVPKFSSEGVVMSFAENVVPAQRIALAPTVTRFRADVRLNLGDLR